MRLFLLPSPNCGTTAVLKWSTLLIISFSQFVNAKDATQEIEENFAFDAMQLHDLNGILLRLKEIAYREVYGDRPFSHDSAIESKKDVTISDQQAKTSRKLLPYLFEGDILLSPKQANSILESAAVNSKIRRSHSSTQKDISEAIERQRRAFSTDSYAKWPKFPVRYRFADSVEFYVISQIIRALDFWQNNTCISFVHDDRAFGDFIQFFRGEGCYSVIGRLGGMQSISIGRGCERMGTIEHEIGHSLGLWHQQSRPDSDEHIQIIEDYILKTYIADFKRRDPDEIETFGIPYDLGSVMHYGSTAFSFDEKSKTLVTKDPYYQQTIGQREKPSFYDVKIINEAYCKDTCKRKLCCKNGGYPNPSTCDVCLCPSGFGGKLCEANEAALETECGGVLTANDKWQKVQSPGYPDPGYQAGERCSWIISAEKGKRIELEFLDDFSLLCTTTCVDYVELKIGADMANTGYRFCCDRAKDPLISFGNQAVIIFYSPLSDDLGFRLQFRATTKEPRLSSSIIPHTTTEAPTTVAGENIWSDWGPWSECTKPCGACGIQTRTRACNSARCTGKAQQFASCNFEACKVDPRCEKIKFLNRLCGVRKSCIEQTSALASCGQPPCCPPFSEVKGVCQSAADDLPPEFVKKSDS